MSKSVKWLFILFLLFLQTRDIQSQSQNDVMINAWLEAGWLKFAPVKKESSTGLDLALKFQRNRILAGIQYHDYIDRDLANGGFELFTSNNYYHAGNVMLGITNKKCRFGHVSISTGLGMFWGEFNGLTEEKFVTLGWPVEAAASLNIFPILGINMKVFTNVNSEHSLIGFGMDLQLGKLRDFTFHRTAEIIIENHPNR